MINYIEKGHWLHREIRKQGHSIATNDGVIETSDDVAVQAIIDAFDPLPEAKAEKIEELKTEALRRANLIYDSDDDVFPSVGHFKLMLDIENTYDRSGAVAPRLLNLNNHLTGYENAVTDINALIDWSEVMAYNVVGTPLWP